MTGLNTATITRVQARDVLDDLADRIREHAIAQYERGKAIDYLGSEFDHKYQGAVIDDERSRVRLWDQFETVTELLLGLIEERSRSATALRLINGGSS